MSDRKALGAADLPDRECRDVVARALGYPAGDIDVVGWDVEVVPYELPAMFTVARHRATARATTPAGEQTVRFFVKTIGSFTRSPLLSQVPSRFHEMVARYPWHVEAEVYRSDLSERLPAGLRMPIAYAVRDLDDTSAACWLEAVPAVPFEWSTDDLAVAAYRLGRFAGSTAVAEVVNSLSATLTLRDYKASRFDHMIVPALRDDELARHPLVACAFGDLRERMLAAVEAVPGWLEELDAVPDVNVHGDTSQNNLLRLADSDDIVLIDFGMAGRRPAGTDLAQLLVGETQLGRRSSALLAADDTAICAAYVAGLHDEGSPIAPEVVRRVHALHLTLVCGLSAYPFAELDQEPTPALMAFARERAAIARYCLDLVDSTAPAGAPSAR